MRLAPKRGVSGCTPYHSRMLHVVDADATATGETTGEGPCSVSDPKSSVGRTVGRMPGGATGAIISSVGGFLVARDGSDEDERGDGKERNMLPPDCQIFDKRRFKSKFRSIPERSNMGR